MKRIETITHDYETELIYLKKNILDIKHCNASFVPKYKGTIQLQFGCGCVRQYSGDLAKRVYNYIHKNVHL